MTSIRVKHRAQLLRQFIGEENVSPFIEKLKQNKKAQAILLHGPSGCGKTTLGRIIATELGVMLDTLDYTELDTADFNGVDTSRQLKRDLNIQPIGEYRVFLLDECHRLTSAAQDALLKALEEPPSYVVFVLCTTEPNKLIKTLRNRCVEFELKPLEKEAVCARLAVICKREQAEVDAKLLDMIAAKSNGSLGTAMKIMEGVIDLPADKQTEAIESYQNTETLAIDLARALSSNKKWGVVKGILKGLQKEDPETIRRIIRGYAQSILLNKENPDAYRMLFVFRETTYENGFSHIVECCYEYIFVRST